MDNEIDFFIRFDKIKRQIVEIDWGILEVEELNEFSYKVALTDHEQDDDHHHGLIFTKKEDGFTLANDLFCTIPVYFLEEEDCLYICSDFERLTEYCSCSVDLSGVWESLLLGSCVYKRTIFEQISQLPNWHEIVVNEQSASVIRQPSLKFFPDLSKTPEELLEEIDQRLTEIFSRFSTERNYVIGVSGGLDSRLTLAYLNKVGISNVQPFTFFASENSLEYSLAKKVCDKFNFKQPTGFKLTEESYNNYINFLSTKSGAQIGYHHSHILNCLSDISEDKSDCFQISNYYTDAIFGWATQSQKTSELDSWTKLITGLDYLDENIKMSICSDIENVFYSFGEDQNFSSKDEYKYIFERNQKFHINLAFQQHRFCKTLLPYCDYKLMKLVFSLPLIYRANKRLSDILLEKMNGGAIYSLSSRQMIDGKSFSQKNGLLKLAESLRFRIDNMLSLSIAKLTCGRVSYKNKYQSEAHYNLYYSLKCKRKIDEDLKALSDAGVMSISAVQWYKDMSPRNGKTSYFFQLHTLANYLKYKNLV
ncbi:hypothetical protein DDN72_11050 [Vibrio cholerae]|nr:hypothetical protein [Vibrio cholerae]BCN18683.1 putative monosaccharide biosynthesis protein [Vibrio cholerae]GHY81695.1 hypothetical protein VCSRO169_2059 [Vibrio cholerae]